MVASSINAGIITAAAAAACCVGSVQSFMHMPSPMHNKQSYSKTTSSLLQQSSTPTPNELFDTPGWESIKAELDQVPIFAVANEQGQPIKYKIEKKDQQSFEVPLFYTHIDDALVELEKAKENTPMPGMDINPYPLGGIFEMWAKDTA